MVDYSSLNFFDRKSEKGHNLQQLAIHSNHKIKNLRINCCLLTIVAFRHLLQRSAPPVHH